MSSRIEIEFRETAFSLRMLTFAVVNREHIDIKEFLTDAYGHFESEIKKLLNIHSTVKVNCVFSATFEKDIIQNVIQDARLSENEDAMEIDEAEVPRELKEKQTLYIHTSSMVIGESTDLISLFKDSVINSIVQKVDDAVLQGSGFKLSTINELIVQVNRLDPLKGSSFIQLPKHLTKKKAIVNVKNGDNMCFKWAVLSALFPATKNVDRIGSYIQYENELNFAGIEFPVHTKHISKFEKLNPSISINVYMYDSSNEKVFPIRLTDEVKQNHIHLLLMSHALPNENPETVNTKTHYCWIKNLSRLVSKQLSNHNGKCHMCDRCLNSFHSLRKLVLHRIDCTRQNHCQIEMPIPGGDTIKFTNIRNQVECPFIIYADVEALLKKPEEEFCKKKESKTVALQEHVVYSVGYYLKCSYDDSLSYYKAKRSPDCVDWFANELYEIAETLKNIFDNIVPIQMTAEDEENFSNATNCHICEQPLHGSVVVKDHSHFTGKYRGAAHQICNLQYQNFRTVPVVFHNLTHYDSHFLIQKISNGFEGHVKIIPNNSENYISFTKTVEGTSKKYGEMMKFKFIDSFRFMASSLDTLSSLIPSEKKTLLRNEFIDASDE